MTPRSLITLAVAVTALLAFAPAPVRGQAPPPPSEALRTIARVPTLRVEVVDAAGAPVAGAFVNFRDLTRGLSGGGMTDASGAYEMRPQLEWGGNEWRFTWVGPQRLEVGKTGYRMQVLERVTLVEGQTHRARVTLELQGPFVPLDADTYARQAADYVLKNMTGPKNATGDVKVIGAPVVLPEFARDGTTRSAPQLPDAFVLVTTAVNGQFREPALVAFRDGTAGVQFSYRSMDGFLPLEEREWQQLSGPLAAFYAVAADVTRGPERFEPFLPSDMRRMFDLKGEKNRLFLPADAVGRLSNDQLRRFAAIYLDAVVLNAWATLAAFPPLSPRLWSPRDVRQDPARVIATGAETLEEIRQELRAAGALEPARMSAAGAYVRRMLGEGLMVREDPDRDGIRNLPARARMYAIGLGGIFPHVALVDGRILIVAVDML